MFVKTLLSDFSTSMTLGFDVETDFQTFTGEYPNKVSLDGPLSPRYGTTLEVI